MSSTATPLGATGAAYCASSRWWSFSTECLHLLTCTQHCWAGARTHAPDEEVVTDEAGALAAKNAAAANAARPITAATAAEKREMLTKAKKALGDKKPEGNEYAIADKRGNVTSQNSARTHIPRHGIIVDREVVHWRGAPRAPSMRRQRRRTIRYMSRLIPSVPANTLGCFYFTLT